MLCWKIYIDLCGFAAYAGEVEGNELELQPQVSLNNNCNNPNKGFMRSDSARDLVQDRNSPLMSPYMASDSALMRLPPMSFIVR